MTDTAPKHPSILPFVVMCAGMFIALLDIQIVASSLESFSDKQREYGSIYPSELNLLKVKLTEQHVASLQDLLSEYSR